MSRIMTSNVGTQWELQSVPIDFYVTIETKYWIDRGFFSEIGVSLFRMNKLLLSNSNFQVFSSF